VTPVYFGRIQTRLFLLAVIGGLWTLLIAPALPGPGTSSDKYQAAFTVLVVVFVVGILWEALYQLLQQFRWEKDWPIMFSLLLGIPEGIVAWLIMNSGSVPGDPAITGSAFFVHFTTVWILTWLFAIGPMRVPFIRWRFRGGRLA
jgi:ABC-type Mn2+/Zn2+ transport system permease subunit